MHGGEDLRHSLRTAPWPASAMSPVRLQHPQLGVGHQRGFVSRVFNGEIEITAAGHDDRPSRKLGQRLVKAAKPGQRGRIG